MKKILLLIACAFLFNSCLFAKSGIFQNFPDGDNVTRVHIGKAMLKMAGKMDVTDGLNDAVKDIKSIDIYSLTNSNGNGEIIRTYLNDILKEQNAEEVVVQKGKGEANEIYLLYSHPTNRDDDPVGMLIVSMEKNEINLVYIEGKINVEALMKE